MPKTLISREGLDKLISELKLLKTIKRPAVIERIQTARSLGDLSENSEYDDARNEQSFIEGRIEQLEGLIKNAKVVENGVNEVVITGSTIELDLNGSEKTYQIVSANEVDPLNNKISIDSPIGKAISGKKVGDNVVVKVPVGDLSAKILKIS